MPLEHDTPGCADDAEAERAEPPEGSWPQGALLRYQPTHLVLDPDCRLVSGPVGPLAAAIGFGRASPGRALHEVLSRSFSERVREAVDLAATTGRGRIVDVRAPALARGEIRVDINAELTVGPAGQVRFLIVLMRRIDDARGPAGAKTPPDASDPPTAEGADPPARGGREVGAAQEAGRTVEQLARANAALAQRADRLAAIADTLASLLENTPVPTLMLDRAFRILGFAPMLATLFRMRRQDVGRSLNDLRTSLDYPALVEDLERVFRTGDGIERELRTVEAPARVYLMQARPFRRDAGEDGLVMTFVEITERKRAEDRLWFLAHHDPLTGLANRVALQEFLDRTAPRDGGESARGALLLLDLDGFKQVNDVYGHAVGDRLLALVGERLRGCIRPSDLVCRLGGDEFAVARPRIDASAPVERLADALIEAVSRPYVVEGRAIGIGLSIGVAYSSPPIDAGALLRAADAALYAAKSGGGGAFRISGPDDERRKRRRASLALDLVGAAGRGEFELFYQPQIRLPDRRPVGAEALIRWRHPTHGLVSPVEFVPIAEETGRISEIGGWVIATACAEAAAWPCPIRVSVNVSAQHVAGTELDRDVRAALAASGLDPARLMLELTESQAIEDSPHSRGTLAALRRLGVGVAVDDFGSGYASFGYLRSFEIDQVKVHGSFVATLQTRESALIVAAVVAVADGMGVRVCAEGAETEASVAGLERLGVGEVQGYFFSPPMPADVLLRWLREPGAAGAPVPVG